MGKFNTKKKIQTNEFEGNLYGHLLEMLRNSERIIQFLSNEKKTAKNFYDASVTIHAIQSSFDIMTSLASTSCELNELKKARRIDEKKIRNRIIDEYDELVQELVNEITVLRNRFHEYQINNFNEVMMIMAESKKQELHKLVKNQELPETMRHSAQTMIKQENEVVDLRNENHELQMTLLKIRSMYTMKEQALKTLYDKKIKTLTDENKSAEEKMWDGFRDSEGRERVLRRELQKLQKVNFSTLLY